MDQVKVKTEGILKLDVTVQKTDESHMDVTGELYASFSQAVDQALGFLPMGLGKGLSKGLFFKYLDDREYTFKVPGLAEIITRVSPQGVMTLSAKYMSLFARPVTEKEIVKLFFDFGYELDAKGVTPSVRDQLDTFIKDFKRNKKGVLDFAALFEGKSLKSEGVEDFTLETFEIYEVTQSQDEEGDLLVHFKGKATY